MSEEAPANPPPPGAPLVVRPSGGANCSSVGSVVDMLFVAGTLGGALLVAVTAALGELETVPSPATPPDPSSPETPASDEGEG